MLAINSTPGGGVGSWPWVRSIMITDRALVFPPRCNWTRRSIGGNKPHIAGFLTFGWVSFAYKCVRPARRGGKFCIARGRCPPYRARARADAQTPGRAHLKSPCVLVGILDFRLHVECMRVYARRGMDKLAVMAPHLTYPSLINWFWFCDQICHE